MFEFFKSKNTIPSKSIKESSYFFKIIRAINARESWARTLTQEDFVTHTKRLQEEYKHTKNLDLLIPDSFALTREAARRVLGERMFDVQLIGGIVLHQGRIAEMKTGEGKTLMSISAAYLNSLAQKSVHIVTVNDYLAKRDAEWMSQIFSFLGRSVGYIVSMMPTEARREMYNKDIIYATNNELGFDYLRDNLRIDKQAVSCNTYHFCIIDEIDSVLIDEARTPLIISGQAQDNTQKYKYSNNIIFSLEEVKKNPHTGKYPDENEGVELEGDYKLDEKSKNVSFTKQGMYKIERLLNQQKIISGTIDSMENFEYVHFVSQSLRAHKLYNKDVDYIISDENKIEIIDEFTGRVLKGRRYSDGLHQAIEAKEGIRIEKQNKTLASVTFQNFFRMYGKLSGMTGTAVTEEKEFTKIYGLDVIEVPTNSPVIRDDREDLIYINKQAKLQAIANEVQSVNREGQPILLGTASIESSEELSRILTKKKIQHNVLNAKNHENEARIIAEAGRKKAVTIATNMAGRGTDIKLGGNLDFRVASSIQHAETEKEQIRIREEEIKKWQSDYEEVRQLGGLYVLGTERHESRRIDNQLRGRSGRQGDSGTSQFFLSLDDQLLRLFGQGLDRMRSLMSRALNEDEPLSHPLISNTMERAQKNVEDRNFEIRKHLLNYDEVLNTQKNTVYSQRETILSSENLIERLQNNVKDILERHTASAHKEEQVPIAIEYVQEELRYSGSIENIDTFEQLLTRLHEDLSYKASLVGDKLFNEIIRVEYLRTIDIQWQEHISQLDEIKQAVHLRSYAQKNPLLEYKFESFRIFEEMIDSISINILRKFLGLRAENIQKQDYGKVNIPQQTQHRQISLLSTSGSTSGARTRENVATTRTTGTVSAVARQKVGRNELCPCGSKKKYKHCHGKIS